jgi:hypothetical protein
MDFLFPGDDIFPDMAHQDNIVLLIGWIILKNNNIGDKDNIFPTKTGFPEAFSKG